MDLLEGVNLKDTLLLPPQTFTRYEVNVNHFICNLRLKTKLFDDVIVRQDASKENEATLI